MDVSGLDMKGTIEWYERENHDIIHSIWDRVLVKESKTEDGPLALQRPQKLSDLGTSPPYLIENPDCVGLPESVIAEILWLCPKNARERSILRRIIGQPQTWFHKDSVLGVPKPTTDLNEALSATAIVPSYIDNTQWQKTGVPQADIWLYKLDATFLKNVREIILLEGLVHEYAHSIIFPALYIDGYSLRLPNEQVVEGKAFLNSFAEAAEHHSPISHYSSTYWKDKRLLRNSDGTTSTMALNEELAETITAYLLGFVFCEDVDRRLKPLKDRSGVEEVVVRFLNAGAM